jgi:hypothetical protein
MSSSRDVIHAIDRYLRFNFYRTTGYISRIDATIIRDLIAGQIEQGIKGSLAEIGVHYGRSFFILALGRTESEKSLAVDLFEDDALHKSRNGIGRFGGFKNNLRRFGFDVSEGEIVKGSSLDLTAEEILSRVGRVRLFSIDGGHMYEHVANDLRLAADVLVEEGVIAMDDMFTALWPEVPIATFDWIRAADNRFVPFLATKDKLYLCDSKFVPFYRAKIMENKRLSARVVRNISVFSQEVLVLSPSATSKVINRGIDSLLSIGRP